FRETHDQLTALNTARVNVLINCPLIRARHRAERYRRCFFLLHDTRWIWRMRRATQQEKSRRIILILALKDNFARAHADVSAAMAVDLKRFIIGMNHSGSANIDHAEFA